MHKLADVLGISQHEGRVLVILYIASLFLGGAVFFFYTSSNAIFLTEFEIDSLPYVYITNAGFVIAFGYIYAQMEKRTDLIGLILISLVMLAASVLIFWIALSLTSSRVVIFLMMAWNRLLFIYATLGLWEIASAVFDVRQAKRLFSLVGLGIITTIIIGGLTISAVVNLVGTVNLLLLSVVSLTLYVGIILRFVPPLISHSPEEEKLPALRLPEMFQDKYIVLIFAIKTLSVLVYYIVEFSFLDLAADRYTTEADLANFLGMFWGISTLAMAFFAAIIAGRYINRYGLRVALLTMPLVIALTSLSSGLYGVIVSIANTSFFVLAVGIKFSNEILEKSIHNPSIAVLYQPLPRRKRMPVRVAVEGWLGSIALVLSGGLLLLFNQLPDVSITFFIFSGFGISVVYAGFILLMHREYHRQLRRSVTSRFVTSVIAPSDLVDTHELAPIGQTSAEQSSLFELDIYSSHPGTVLATLAHYMDRHENLSASMLESLLDHPADEVKIDVLQRSSPKVSVKTSGVKYLN